MQTKQKLQIVYIKKPDDLYKIDMLRRHILCLSGEALQKMTENDYLQVLFLTAFKDKQKFTKAL